MFFKIFHMLKDPQDFFSGLGGEGFREPMIFLISVSAFMAPFTALVNFLGWPSTDLSSSLQAQILAWRITEQYLLPRIGLWAYGAEVGLIIVFTLLFAALLGGFIHLLYKLLGGKGGFLNAWKAVCYGVGPCVILGWIPYWSLFVASWALVVQMYYAPKTLYRLREGRSLIILAAIIASTLLEFAMGGTTVGFGPK